MACRIIIKKPGPTNFDLSLQEGPSLFEHLNPLGEADEMTFDDGEEEADLLDDEDDDFRQPRRKVTKRKLEVTGDSGEAVKRPKKRGRKPKKKKAICMLKQANFVIAVAI